MSEPKRLSEEEVAEIRHGGIGHTREFYAHGTSAENCALRNANYLEKLLADRDAHLAELKEARECLQEHIAQCVNGGPRTCCICKRSDALLEWTK